MCVELIETLLSICDKMIVPYVWLSEKPKQERWDMGVICVLLHVVYFRLNKESNGKRRRLLATSVAVHVLDSAFIGQATENVSHFILARSVTS